MTSAFKRIAQALFGQRPGKLAAMPAPVADEDNTEERVAELRQLLEKERTEQHWLQARLAETRQQLQTQVALIGQLESSVQSAGEASAFLSDAVSAKVKAMEQASKERRQELTVRKAQLGEQIQRSLRQREQIVEQLLELASTIQAGVEVGEAERRPGPDRALEGRAIAAGGRVLPFRTALSPAEGGGMLPGEKSLAALIAGPATVGWRPGTVAQSELSAPPLTAPAAEEASVAPAQDSGSDEAASVMAEQVGAGIRNRVSLNLTRMLEGKVVGQDLHGSDGKLLARRGTPITPELVAQAEAADTLPDLILYMTWPEDVAK